MLIWVDDYATILCPQTIWVGCGGEQNLRCKLVEIHLILLFVPVAVVCVFIR